MVPVEAGGSQAGCIAIVVACSAAAREVVLIDLQLPLGATVRDALQASGLPQCGPDVDLASGKVGVWGKLCSLDHTLRDGDRVELYRPLTVDPKEARRQRYRSHRDKLKAAR